MTDTDIKDTFPEVDDDIPHEMICGAVGVVVVLILTIMYLNFMNAIIQSRKNEM